MGAEIVHMSTVGLDHSTQWKYRICAFDRCYCVVVSRGNSSFYTTQLYSRSQCQVMFHAPVNFNANNKHPVADVKPAQEFRIPVKK